LVDRGGPFFWLSLIVSISLAFEIRDVIPSMAPAPDAAASSSDCFRLVRGRSWRLVAQGPLGCGTYLEELKEGRDRIAKKIRANLVELFKKWTEEAGEIYKEVEREILWLGGVKFVGVYRSGRQTWTQAEPDEADEEEVIED
jgi:hypothetical protein